MKVSALFSRVRDRLGEDQSGGLRYTDGMLREFLREAVEQWSIRVGGRIATQTITLAADTLIYQLSDDPVRVISVIESTDSLPLVPASYQDLYNLEGWDWRSVQSNRPTMYSLFSLREIWLWPTMSSVSGEYVTVTYQQAFSTLTSSDTLATTDELLIPREFHTLLIEYLVGRCLMIGARDEGRLSRATEAIRAWQAGLENMRDLRANRAS